MTEFAAWVEELKSQLDGDCYTDDMHKGVYSTDASMYQILPRAVIFPKNNEDLKRVVAFSSKYKIPVLARGGGTSLAGQAISSGIVLDFTKYLNRIIEFDQNNKWMRVEPGIVRDEVNVVAAKAGMEFAPDPATSSRATIGGMIANNSSGTKSILYGKTSDHVLEMEVLLADGSIQNIGPCDIDSVKDNDALSKLHQLVNGHSNAIKERFPKTMRRVNGYCLDELLDDQPWHPYKVFIGSEGTLGIILSAKINLVALPKYKAAAIVHFEDTIEAVRAVGTMLKFKPAAVEIMSDDLLNYSRKNLVTRGMSHWINGLPKSVQLVEFYADTKEDITDRANKMFDALRQQELGYAYDLYHAGGIGASVQEGAEYNNVWSIRKRGLGLLLGEPNDQRCTAFIEDAAIPVEHLPEYIEKVMAICDRYHVDAAYYAHASVGVIHVRPVLDLRVQEDVDKMKDIANEVFQLVVEYGGAWSGEHGDGLVRSPFLREYFGEEIYQALVEVKKIFDPENIMNPGKIIDAPPMDQNLRYGAKYKDLHFEPQYHYRVQKSFQTAVHQCSGIGSCRKVQGSTMCPSYMATRDDAHSTRGRANTLRLAMSGQISDMGIADPAVMEAMDLCLSCKACKSECPSSVDMARLKSEALQVHYDNKGVPLRDRLVRDSAQTAALIAGPLAFVVNRVQNTSLFKQQLEYVAGIDKRRTLPQYASQTFSKWYKKNYRDKGHSDRVGLFADTYLNYHEPSIGRAAVRVIQALGYDVDLLEGCCQRPRISHGFLKLAKKEGLKTCNSINDYNNPVLVCEPGCLSALVDDLPDLIADEQIGNAIKQKALPIEKWMADAFENSGAKGLSSKNNNIILHGHCHQKSLFGTDSIHRIFAALGVKIFEPDSGCCGMGGSFGYEKEHYEISQNLAERVLLKELDENPEALVIASGFSCRHQIEHFGKREVIHWLEAIELIDN